jgi:hypothetical protein
MTQDQDIDLKQALMKLGALTGEHRAFSLVANRCSAADAETLKGIRDEERYKLLGITWEEYCVQYAGISRSYADQHIQCFEEYGDSYRRMAEIMSMSPPTYRLIAGAVTENGLEFQGECIPIKPENRIRIAKAVKEMRAQKRAGKAPAAVSPAILDNGLEKLVKDVIRIAGLPEHRAAVMVFVERAHGRFDALLQGIRKTTIVVR